MSRAQLKTAALALGDLNSQVVFLGGASVELWITDPTTREPRMTYDVDVVIEVTTLAGFSGRWLANAAAAAAAVDLTPDLAIRAVPAAWLIVLKLEAFASRGDGDAPQSRDFEDIILLIDGREELAAEVAALPADARASVADGLDALTKHRFIDYAVEGALVAPDARARAINVTLPRLHALATMHAP